MADRDKIGVDVQCYPAVFRHLQQWQNQLERRYDKGNYWWELRACDYYDEFEKPKIVYPEIAREPRFTLDETCIYPLKTVFSIPIRNLFLIALLNSTVTWTFLKRVCCMLGDEESGGRLTLQSTFVSRLPIPRASEADRTAIEELAQKCLDAKGQGCEEWEREIDLRVHFLYFGRSPGEPLRDFHEAMDLRRKEVPQLIAHGEGKRLEFKESLEWDTREARPNRELVRSVLTTVCGFLNTTGGTLLIGISDTGEVKGLKDDYQLCGKARNKGGFELKLRDLIEKHLEPRPYGLIEATFVPFPEGDVCRVDISPSSRPVWLDGKELCIREGNHTVRLVGPSLGQWLEGKKA